MRAEGQLTHDRTAGGGGGVMDATAFIVYDVTNRASFEHVVERWLVQLRTHTHQSIVLCVLGNKCDLGGNRQARSRAIRSVQVRPGLCS